jgi:hypothetical protein
MDITKKIKNVREGHLGTVSSLPIVFFGPPLLECGVVANTFFFTAELATPTH